MLRTRIWLSILLLSGLCAARAAAQRKIDPRPVPQPERERPDVSATPNRPATIEPPEPETFVRTPNAVVSARRWLAELADRDPAVRRMAREHLMSLQASELPALKALVRAAQPLRPAQAEALREIVTHVYISGMIDRHVRGDGFLGVNLGTEMGQQEDADAGALIVGPIEGYCAYPFLRGGDVVIAISVPAAEDPEPVRVRSTRDLQRAIGQYPSGTRVTLIYRRGGRLEHATMRLDPRPNTLTMTDELVLRQNEAELLWETDFSSLIDSPPAVKAAH